MKHYGDITKLNGAELPAVDVITGGSPCQDLSVAGKRAGLGGERSGLFMEQVRIVKEMREEYALRTDVDVRFVKPRFMLWENVPGALSSGNPRGADFQAVLQETCKIVCKDAPVVPISKEGWTKSGCISGVGDSGIPFSIGWRIHDAQFWGVPQRRKRIALVADFAGLSAPEILFERKGMFGGNEPCIKERKATPGTTGRSVNSTGKSMNTKILYDAYQHHGWKESNTCGTLTEGSGRVRGDTPLVVSINSFGSYSVGLGTLRASGGDYGGGSEILVANAKTVRRLMPMECERLQGFPDGWTDIGKWTDSNGKSRQTADSSRYKALGNSIALPYWKVLARRISAQYDRDITMGSLFDGIGGFPVAFEHCGGKALWASEIEEFCIAVTKKRFPEEENNERD